MRSVAFQRQNEPIRTGRNLVDNLSGSSLKKSATASLVLSCLIFAFASPAVASSLGLTKVADLRTKVPNGAGTFSDLFRPAISGTRVAFAAFSGSGLGIYLFEGGTLGRVADTSTSIPRGTGTFTGFDADSLVLSDHNLAFAGFGESGQQGIYIFDGSTLRRMADLSMPIPHGTGTFTGFGPPAISGGNVVFVGLGDDEQQGIYLYGFTTLVRVADTSTPIPDGTGTFTRLTSPALGPPAIRGSTVAFRGTGEFSQAGVYQFKDGILSRVADTSTPIPNGFGDFLDFTDPVLGDGTIAFLGIGGAGELGIYLFEGNARSRVVDRSTPIPHGTGTFGNFSAPLLSEKTVAFEGFGAAGQDGVYQFHDGTLGWVADLNTSIPNGTGTFSDLLPPVLSGHNVAFVGSGTTPEQQGVYLSDGSTLSRIADRYTLIPNGSGAFDGFRLPAMSGDNIAFQGFSFQSGFQLGIYLGHAPAAAPRR